MKDEKGEKKKMGKEHKGKMPSIVANEMRASKAKSNTKGNTHAKMKSGRGF